MENDLFNTNDSNQLINEVAESKNGIALCDLEKKNKEKKIILKANPDLYKLRIGKKKTGLPNFDYPPINLSNKIKNSNFSVFSIEYDEMHFENFANFYKNENHSKNYEKKNQVDNYKKFDPTRADSNNTLNEKLINHTINGENNDNSNFDYNDVDGLKYVRKKKCCQRCLLF